MTQPDFIFRWAIAIFLFLTSLEPRLVESQSLETDDSDLPAQVKYEYSVEFVVDSSVCEMTGNLVVIPLKYNKSTFSKPEYALRFIYMGGSATLDYDFSQVDVCLCVREGKLWVDEEASQRRRHFVDYRNPEHQVLRQFLSLFSKQLFQEESIVNLSDTLVLAPLDAFDGAILLEKQSDSALSVHSGRYKRAKGLSHEWCNSLFDPEDRHLLFSQGQIQFRVKNEDVLFFYRLKRKEFTQRDRYLNDELPFLEDYRSAMIVRACIGRTQGEFGDLYKRCRAVVSSVSRPISAEIVEEYSALAFHQEKCTRILQEVKTVTHLIEQAIENHQTMETVLREVEPNVIQYLRMRKRDYSEDKIAQQLDIFHQIGTLYDFYRSGMDSQFELDIYMWALAKNVLTPSEYQSPEWKDRLLDFIMK